MPSFPTLPETPGLPEGDPKGKFLRELARCSASVDFNEYLELLEAIESNRKGCLGIFLFLWKEEQGAYDIHQHDIVAQLISEGSFRRPPLSMDLQPMIMKAKSLGFTVYRLGEQTTFHRVDRPMQVAQRFFMTNDGYCVQIDEINVITWDPTPITLPKSL